MKKHPLYLLLILILFIGLESSACTTFLISGRKTPDGRPLLFKNRDTDKMQNALVSFNDGKYKYIGVVDGTPEWKSMVWGGYNEKGFAIINSAAYNNNVGDTSKFIDQEGVIMKLALQNCRTLADFEELLTNLPKPMGLDANFGVIDSEGGAAYYETGNYNFKKYDANDPAVAPDGVLIRTNHSMRGDRTKGFGYGRYYTAEMALRNAIESKNLTPQYLFNQLSRNFYHSITRTTLTTRMPVKRDVEDFRFFLDYIPRESTASAILIVGAGSPKQIREIMAWTIIGFPLTSVAIPSWINISTDLPKAVKPGNELKSPLCIAALKMKADCFPINYDRGYNYINLSAVVNKQGNGYLQILRPIEDQIFKNSQQINVSIHNGKTSEKELTEFYAWIDSYLASSYMNRLNIRLFEE